MSLLLALFGCTQMAIEGQILDVTGAPVPGAAIQAYGAPCLATTDLDGKYSLACKTGTYTIYVTADGFLSKNFEVEAIERTRYELGKQILIRLPTQRGLLTFDGSSYQQLKPGKLRKNTTDRVRSYCLDLDSSEPNPAVPGVLDLFDNDSEGWRPFRLDADGCAYRDRILGPGEFDVEYKKKAEFKTEDLEGNRQLVGLTLNAGDYFIADWRQGFFSIDPADKKAYTGHWLHVQ
ncbi:MAG: carboxypeptidase-like regulatory domain-containing protein [Myxococcota bacterium]|nr:carboxypeptidase-like regulatory domain-containing protein [Myxococcota bacterium]